MWKNTYKDYKPDSNWVQEEVEPTQGIIGCEMHELNGWGNRLHVYPPKKKGVIRTFFSLIFKREES